VDELYAIKKNLFLCYLVFDTSNSFTRLLVHSSTIVNLIHRLKIRRALIPFELTPFWLAKDAL